MSLTHLGGDGRQGRHLEEKVPVHAVLLLEGGGGGGGDGGGRSGGGEIN